MIITQPYRKVVQNGSSIAINIPPEAEFKKGDTVHCKIENGTLMIQKITKQ